MDKVNIDSGFGGFLFAASALSTFSPDIDGIDEESQTDELTKSKPQSNKLIKTADEEGNEDITTVPPLLNIPLNTSSTPPPPSPLTTTCNTITVGSKIWEYNSKGKWTLFGDAEMEILEGAFAQKTTHLFLECTKLVHMVNLLKMETIVNNEPMEIRRLIVLHVSYVLKETKFGWHKRQFVITSQYLLFYDNDRVAEVPTKSITDVTYDDVRRDFVVTILTDKKSYLIAASTAEVGKRLFLYINQVREGGTIIPPPEEDEGRYCLAFPSISTAAFKFDDNEAADVAVDVISNFLETHPDPRLRLVLVDIKESATLEHFRTRAATLLERDSRFSIKIANLTSLKSNNLTSWYIVNASNAKFNDGGSGTNEAIHKACSGSFAPNLKQLTLQQYKPPAEVGKDYPVDLPSGCPLRDTQNVHCVIHVVGPNMCPKRPNCLNNDYKTGRKLLRDCYTNILQCFYNRTGIQQDNH